MKKLAKFTHFFKEFFLLNNQYNILKKICRKKTSKYVYIIKLCFYMYTVHVRKTDENCPLGLTGVRVMNFF
jgi:hypothetical protein